MGIDASDLARFSPWAQKQIAKKLVAQEREQAARKEQISTRCIRDSFPSKESKGRKYHNEPTERITEGGMVIKFGSTKEARRYDELILMLRAGRIRDLKLQPQFTIQESYVTADGQRIRAIRYHADFSYERLEKRRYVMDGGESKKEEDEWVYFVEDVKGGKATKTDKYKLKKKLIQERFGITIQEIE